MDKKLKDSENLNKALNRLIEIIKKDIIKKKDRNAKQLKFFEEADYETMEVNYAES